MALVPSPPSARLLALAAWSACVVALAGEPVLRQEENARFVPDDAFLAQGGVQYFYDFLGRDEDGPVKPRAFGAFGALDAAGRWGASHEKLFAVATRFVYEVDKDVAFFSTERVLNAAYNNRVCPSCDVRALAPGVFSVGQRPANTARVRRYGAAQFAAVRDEPWARGMLSLQPGTGQPDVVVVQENDDFRSLFGMATGAGSVTVTVHEGRGPGRTRLSVVMLSLMHNIPPFFLGGRGRVHDVTLDGALSLIRHLRAYPAP